MNIALARAVRGKGLREAGAVLLLLALGVAGCSPPRAPTTFATYDAPKIPPECQQAVYSDPKVRDLMIAGAGQPALAAETQNQLAFAQDEALRRCEHEKGIIPPGGVEPVRYYWYKSPF